MGVAASSVSALRIKAFILQQAEVCFDGRTER